MKKIVIILFTTLLFIAVVGCAPESRPDPDGYDKTNDFTFQDFTYRIAVSFCNASGEDIVAPLGEERWTYKANTYWNGEINPDKYDLTIDLSVPWKAYSYHYLLPTVYKPTFKLEKFDKNYQSSSIFGEEYREGDGKYYLTNVVSMPTYFESSDDGDIEEMACQDYITYQMACPIIFEDSSVHTLVAYWVEDPATPSDWDYPLPPSQNPQCIRATFDGKDVIVKQHNLIYFIDIVLDE